MSAGAGRGPAAPPAPPQPPQPLLAKESGNAVTNALADVVDKTAKPFQNLNQPNVSAFEKAQGVVGAVAGLAKAPTEFMDNAFARATSSISQALPSFPAATMGAPVIGIPHTHTHPPSLIPPAPPIPLPAIGTVLTGCPSVLIGGVPAARSGDFGIAPTCGSLAPVFEIFTGSSKVFIGGARAARMVDMTRQCMQPPKAGGAAKGAAAAGAVSKVAKARAAAGKVIGGAAKLAPIMAGAGALIKIASTQSAAAAAAQASADAAQAAADAGEDAADAAADAAGEAKAKAASAAADAAAAILAAAMMAADLGVDAAKKALGGMMGKDPGMPMCIGAVMMGTPNVLIGGFPMPSWSDVAKGLKKLGAALQRGRRGGAARGRGFCLGCM